MRLIRRTWAKLLRSTVPVMQPKITTTSSPGMGTVTVTLPADALIFTTTAEGHVTKKGKP
jgi:hypothetical protein